MHYLGNDHYDFIFYSYKLIKAETKGKTPFGISFKHNPILLLGLIKRKKVRWVTLEPKHPHAFLLFAIKDIKYNMASFPFPKFIAKPAQDCEVPKTMPFSAGISSSRSSLLLKILSDEQSSS